MNHATGFAWQVLFILLVTCGEMAIVLCYFQLCNENYQWQWRAFLNTGSAGLFLFGYSFVYFSSTLEIMGGPPRDARATHALSQSVPPFASPPRPAHISRGTATPPLPEPPWQVW